MSSPAQQIEPPVVPDQSKWMDQTPAPPVPARIKFWISMAFLAMQALLGLVFIILGLVVPRCDGWHLDDEYYNNACGRTLCCSGPCSEGRCMYIPYLHILDIVGIAMICLAVVTAAIIICYYRSYMKAHARAHDDDVFVEEGKIVMTQEMTAAV